MPGYELSHASPLFSTLKDELDSLSERLNPIPEETGGGVHAAVSVVLREGDGPEILLIKRAEADGDPWSGQMALPGGRRDSQDGSLLQTAMRETEEEVSLALAESGTLLGRLEPMIPATKRLPPITIFPYVFSVPQNTPARVASREVDEVHWVPLSALQDPAAAGTVEIHYSDDSSRVFPCLRLGERVVWGLTYRILTGFLGMLNQEGRGDEPRR